MDSALVAMLPSKLLGFPCNKMSPHDPMNPLQTSLGIKGVESFSGIAEEILFPSLERINDSVKNFTPRKNIIRDVLSNQDRILYKHS